MRATRMATIYVLGMIFCSCVLGKGITTDFTKTKETGRKSNYSGEIQLYGETHGVKKILDKEVEIWIGYYQKGDRHLFVELPYYTAEYLNVWMKESNDKILDEVYADWSGTASHTPDSYDFFKTIKAKCPDTIFHGTDVGHQYGTTGERFLIELEKRNRTGTKQYELAKEAIEQGKKYYSEQNDIYRENAMVENFIRESELVNNENIVGIYGSAHTGLTRLDNSGKIPCMANQLSKVYASKIQSTDLSFLAKEIEPSRVETVTVNNKEYTAYYYGKQDLRGFKDYLCREFWMLEGAYNDLQNCRKTGDYLPYHNYPMNVDASRVYIIDYTKEDRTKIRMYYRTDGELRDGEPISSNIEIK